MHQIKIHTGEMARLKVDALVTPTIDQEKIYKGIAKHTLTTLKKLESLAEPIPGFAVRVSVGEPFHSREVLHISPPTQDDEEEFTRELVNVYEEMMTVAKDRNYRSLAIHPIRLEEGSNTDEVTIAVDQIRAGLRTNITLESVIVCCGDVITAARFRDRLGR